MPSTEQTVRTYRELAENYGRQGQAQMRDRFLVLAADAALAADQKDEAERLRGRLLQHNPHHLLKPYSSFAEAMKSVDVQNYIGALRRNHPSDKAENLLEGIRHSTEHPAPALPLAQAGASGDDLRVFRSASNPAGPRAVPSTQSSQPARDRPAAGPDIVPIRRESYAPAGRLPTSVAGKDDGVGHPGAWVATLLFFVVLATGLFLVGYTVIQPFAP